ncbi:unnamed protein product [Calypogeia fissa]
MDSDVMEKRSVKFAKRRKARRQHQGDEVLNNLENVWIMRCTDYLHPRHVLTMCCGSIPSSTEGRFAM